MNICEACEQFGSRVKRWNYTHGATDPLPYIDEMVKSHKHLNLEDRGRDGAGGSTLIPLSEVRQMVDTLCLDSGWTT